MSKLLSTLFVCLLLVMTGCADTVNLDGIADSTESITDLPDLDDPIVEVLICGDINGDGFVNVLDALMASQVAVGLIVPTAKELLRGDIDGNGYIDVLDALGISQFFSGLIDLDGCANSVTPSYLDLTVI